MTDVQAMEEPPNGTVVLDKDNHAWQRNDWDEDGEEPGCWYVSTGWEISADWVEVLREGPVTVIWSPPNE